MRIAIIGAGVAGLVAARQLYQQHDLVVFEKNNYLGGHAHTVTVEDSGLEIALDTGFIVFNDQNYPRFNALLAELGVESQPSEMSFGVSCEVCNVGYSSRGIRGLFASPGQLFSLSVYQMALDILRFNRWSRNLNSKTLLFENTVGGLRRSRMFSSSFFRHYLVPMTSAIWSSTSLDVDEIPLAFVLNFYRNHGLLQTSGHPQWRTVVGGSRSYVEALVAPFLKSVRLSTPVQGIRRGNGFVEVKTQDGCERFDKLVLATHTDEASRLLEDGTACERAVLDAIPYSKNEGILHTDERVLARSRMARASWNCSIIDCRDPDEPLRITYDLNRLQQLQTSRQYCVTLNNAGRIDPEKILLRLSYAHPLYTPEGLVARKELAAANGKWNTFFCGAYLGNGFHEDGVVAGMETAALILDSGGNG
tara:strand:- start:1962 stop:3221 length:1260 start_codon:yes stop_codon:yes gene_type:complete